MDIGNVESQIENIEREADSKIKEKEALEIQVAHLQDAISRLIEDVELSQTVSGRMSEQEKEKQTVEQELDGFRERVGQIETELQELTSQAADSEEVLSALTQFGEDVEEGLAILEERQRLIEECTIQLQELIGRLGLASAEFSSESIPPPLLEAESILETPNPTSDKQGMNPQQNGIHPETQTISGNDNVMSVGKKWTSALSVKEADAIKDYTGMAYVNINSVLRGIDSSFSNGNYERAVLIHKSLSRCRIPQPCIVYRGASTAALGKMRNLSDEQLIGKIISDDGFMSTSLNCGDAFGGDIKLEISVPAGAHGAYVGYLSQCGHNESEVLFDMGQMMRITKIRRDMFGNRIICANLLVKEND